MEHLRRGELRDPKPQEISTPQELLEHAKTCKKTLRVWASYFYYLDSFFIMSN